MRRISLAGASAAFAGALLIIGGGAIGSASPAHAAPQRAGVQQAPQAVAEEVPSTTTTLPLFGAPLTIDVTSAPGGAISSVTVDPSDGLTASTVKPNKVRFLNEDGTATVQVSARNGGQKVQARAGQLSDILGPGSWSGDLWGQNAPTTVNFVIAATPAGGPDITNVQVSDPNAEISPVSYKDHGDEHRARVTIRFSNGVDQRWLGISAAVGSHDGESRATLSVGLSDATGERLPTEDVVGAHSWTGTLCDGSVAQVNYTVNADRSVSDVSANPDTATIKAGWHGAFVAFSDHEVVKIRVKGSDDGTTLRIDADEWFRCDNADPTVNTPIDESHDNHDGHDGHDGDGRGDHGGWPGWPGDGGHDGQSCVQLGHVERVGRHLGPGDRGHHDRSPDSGCRGGVDANDDNGDNDRAGSGDCDECDRRGDSGPGRDDAPRRGIVVAGGDGRDCKRLPLPRHRDDRGGGGGRGRR